jgi:hypothetical protein
MVFFYHGLVYNVTPTCVDNILAHTHIMFSSTTNLLEVFKVSISPHASTHHHMFCVD